MNGVDRLRRVLLIYPPCTMMRFEPKVAIPPLGLLYMAGVLRERGRYEVEILDAVVEGYHHEEALDRECYRYGLTFGEIGERIRRLRPDLVGISCLFSTQVANALKVAEVAKQVSSRVITVMGGAHPSSQPREVLADPHVDFVILGEGEYRLPRLLDCLNGEASLASLDGVAYRGSGNATEVQEPRGFITDLDALPGIPWELIPMERYFAIDNPHGALSRQRPVAPVLTSRGCPARCVFCASHRVHGRAFRAHSSERVLEDIARLVRGYGVREIQFEDDNLTHDRERALRIFRGIRDAGFGITWMAPNGIAIWRLDDELLAEMKQSGCYMVMLAIESGVERILRDVIHKPLQLGKVGGVIDALRRLGIAVTAFFVVGFPGETKDEIRRTFRYAEQLKLDNVNYSIAIPLPGSELHQTCMERGLLRPECDYLRYRSRIATTVSEHWAPEELERMVAWASLRFRLLLLRRDPAEFFRRTVMRLVRKPGYFTSYLWLLLRRTLSPAGGPVRVRP